MNKLAKVLIAFGVGVVGSIVGWIAGTENSIKYHEKEIEKRKKIINNINNQISSLEQTIIDDRVIRVEEIEKLKAKISKLNAERKFHQKKIEKHENKIKTPMNG